MKKDQSTLILPGKMKGVDKTKCSRIGKDYQVRSCQGPSKLSKSVKKKTISAEAWSFTIKLLDTLTSPGVGKIYHASADIVFFLSELASRVNSEQDLP